jgi:peptidoglycan/xylan/chitin deacetylase (PgdA/CDA1 family)
LTPYFSVKWMSFWPKGYKCCVNLSFDYDSDSATIWRTPLDIVNQSRGRFAPNVAIPRILEVLARHELKATFYTPGWTADKYPDSVESIIEHGHEVGAHGYTHERLAELSWELEESVFERSLVTLKKFGVKPEGFRAPYWLISDRTIERIKQFGFKYDSDFMDSDMPYMLEWRGKPTGLVELPVEWMLDDWPQFDTYRRSPEDAYKVWKAEFEGIYRLERYFGLTCHPQAIGRISRLDMLEMLITEMEQKGDVWFATGKEVADWTRKKLG